MLKETMHFIDLFYLISVVLFVVSCFLLYKYKIKLRCSFILLSICNAGIALILYLKVETPFLAKLKAHLPPPDVYGDFGYLVEMLIFYLLSYFVFNVLFYRQYKQIEHLIISLFFTSMYYIWYSSASAIILVLLHL